MRIKKIFKTLQFSNPMKVLLSLILKSAVDIKLKNGLVFKDCVDEHASILHEVFGEECYTKYRKIGKKDIVVDAGASIGDFTLLALKSGARVFPFESSSKIQKMLIKNLIVNGHSTQETFGKFDKYSLKPFNRIDFLKIDIEGGEFDSILGMKNSDLKKARYVAMEVHHACGDTNALIEKFERCGFKTALEQHPNSKDMGYIYARLAKSTD